MNWGYSMLKGLKVGFGLTGSFCTFEKVIPQIQKIVENGAEVIPIMSKNASCTDSRFGNAKDFKEKISLITGKEIIDTIVGAEPLGPNNMVDIVVIAPCTGDNI